MNLTDYQPLALRTEKPLPTVIERLAHAGIGLFTESGEIATCVKRITIYGKSLDDLDKSSPPKSLRHNIGEEIGDAFWYLAIGCSATTLPLQSLMANLQPYPTTLALATFSLAEGVGKFSKYLRIALLSPEPASLSAHECRVANDYMRLIAQALVDIVELAGLDLRQILDDNIAKLRERFPDAYSNEAAEARADKGGADARNS